MKNSVASFSPAATLSAGKLIRGFALRTLGQLPSLWTVEAGPSLAFESGRWLSGSGDAVGLKSGGFRRFRYAVYLRDTQNLICIMRRIISASSAD